MAAAAHADGLVVTGGRDVEIVAVDAFTIYRGLDIASAKPSTADRDAVPHHLVDVLDVSEEVSVARFQGWARRAIAEVHDRDRVPVLVGGSGLYFRAVVDDLEFPPTDPDVRAGLEERWADDPRGAHDAVAAVDPDAAERIEPDNLRRSVRALEVMALTDRPCSSFRTAWDDHDSRYDLVVDYLEPSAEVLRERIATRSERMVATGLVDEVAALDRHGLSTTAVQGIGVAEALAVLDGELAVDELGDAISRRTWNYARRQRSWFRKDPRCRASRHPSGAELLAVHGVLEHP
ncbi:tRNA (adenosine(37)-N6)-dimethylallyltransferase MiaA [Nitriliruptoria bacterium AS10]|nr:tRNA (adenosine(37)-N6)-dimethylallyltransferase MiaA [Salsipaludibacter albus]